MLCNVGLGCHTLSVACAVGFPPLLVEQRTSILYSHIQREHGFLPSLLCTVVSWFTLCFNQLVLARETCVVCNLTETV